MKLPILTLLLTLPSLVPLAFADAVAIVGWHATASKNSAMMAGAWPIDDNSVVNVGADGHILRQVANSSDDAHLLKVEVLPVESGSSAPLQAVPAHYLLPAQSDGQVRLVYQGPWDNQPHRYRLRWVNTPINGQGQPQSLFTEIVVIPQ